MSVGFPGTPKLDDFGFRIWEAFGEFPYHVGSSLELKTGWRDVDVRLIIFDEDYPALGFGPPERPNGKWRAICEAWSIYGQHLTGLPIDFQIQQQSWANKTYPGIGNRSALGINRWSQIKERMK